LMASRCRYSPSRSGEPLEMRSAAAPSTRARSDPWLAVEVALPAEPWRDASCSSTNASSVRLG
jgi:hypothetical protein